MSKVTHERLTELLEYNPDTGEFRWKPMLRKNKNKEGVAGTKNSRGYLQITIDYKIYLAHRLAWFYVHKRWPSRIDHRDEVKTNNRIKNLREASGTENNGNSTATAGNKTGYRGVVQYANKFSSTIYHEGRRYYLGMFDSAEKAHEAYQEMHLKLHGEFSIYHEAKVCT